MTRPQSEEDAPTGAPRTVSSFPYYSGTGKCIVKQLAGDRPFWVYLVEQNGPPRRLESHRTQENAEAFARWMAMGL